VGKKRGGKGGRKGKKGGEGRVWCDLVRLLPGAERDGRRCISGWATERLSVSVRLYNDV